MGVVEELVFEKWSIIWLNVILSPFDRQVNLDSSNSFAKRNCLHCLHITGPSNIWCVSYLRSVHWVHTVCTMCSDALQNAILSFVLCSFYRFMYVLSWAFLLSSSLSHGYLRQIRSCFSKPFHFCLNLVSRWILLSSIFICIQCSLSHALKTKLCRSKWESNTKG